ncbi:hypothetical protein NW755_014341 [Fusarium falciforme]|uniref:NAD(P)-binding protein n=1 Tax=Fusarium falciforme TaxID=195108 RepID=A0A9W8QU55_9HYPO|nr:hypothetical protein NW755_014341 [Fusarium falciforme]KAJ4232960.1 hypothetical protein NW757_013737 [Fusarium falciforme]
MSLPNLVWFITGANSGFGLELTLLALSKGHTVIATARDINKFPQELRDNPNADLVVVHVDKSSNISTVIDNAVSKHGRIDVLVNNAGFGYLGAVEEVSEKDARYQFEVNFFAVFNLSKAVIPHMRRPMSGTIVQVSSAAGIVGQHGSPIYSASKFALEGLNEAMYKELQPFGIRVHIVEPGIFRTSFLGLASKGQNISQPKEGYMDIRATISQVHGKQAGDPRKGVKRIFEVVTGT